MRGGEETDGGPTGEPDTRGTADRPDGPGQPDPGDVELPVAGGGSENEDLDGADPAGPAGASGRSRSMADRAAHLTSVTKEGASLFVAGTTEPRESRERSIHWLADYVYGSISTLVAIAGLTFETNPGALTTAGVVVVGAVAIWFAHGLSRTVVTREWRDASISIGVVWEELRTSWPIVSAALPATVVFVLAGMGLFTVRTAFGVAEVVGILALAVVGCGTVGRGDAPLARRVLHIVGMVGVGLAIVILELVVHLL